MAAKVTCSDKSLCEATLGKALPSWRITQEFLRACGISQPDITGPWHTRWQAAHQVAEILKAPDRRGISEPTQLIALLHTVMRARGITVDYLLKHIPAIDVPELDHRVTWSRPSVAVLTAVLDHTAPPERGVVILVLAACGAAHAEITAWLKHPGINRILRHPVAAPTAGHETTAEIAPPHHADQPALTGLPQPPPDAGLAETAGSIPPASPDEKPSPGAAATLANRWSHRYRQLVIVGGLVAAALGAGTLIGPFNAIRDHRQGLQASTSSGLAPSTVASVQPAAATVPGTESSAHQSVSRPARVALADLSVRVARSPATAPSGPVTYIHTRTWRPDDTSDAAEPFAASDVQLWWRPERTGLQITAPLPSDGEQHTASALVSTRTLDPQSLNLPIGEPAADPGILAHDLDAVSPGIDTAGHALQSIIQLYRYYCPNPQQRAAMLRVLADIRGLLTTGIERDRLDRNGLQITAIESGNTTQQRAFFDPDTGTLLSAETVRIPPVVDTLSAPTITDAVVFYPCEHRVAIG